MKKTVRSINVLLIFIIFFCSNNIKCLGAEGLGYTVSGTKSISGGSLINLSDNNRNTFWHYYGENGYIKIDLENWHSLDNIKIILKEKDKMNYFSVIVSAYEDFSNYKTVFETKENYVLDELNIKCDNKVYRYVKIFMNNSGNSYLLLSDIQVFGVKKDDSVLYGKKISGTHSDNGGDLTFLTDGFDNSFWHHYGKDAFFTIDLGARYDIESLTLKTRSTNLLNYFSVYISNSSDCYEEEINITNNTVNGTLILQINKTCRYLTIKKSHIGSTYLIFTEILAIGKINNDLTSDLISDIYVSHTGNDINNGTKQSPVRTIKAAQKIAEKNIVDIKKI